MFMTKIKQKKKISKNGKKETLRKCWFNFSGMNPNLRAGANPLALTHRMSMRTWTLAHWRRWGLHPWWWHAVRVGGHGRASHAWHRGRVAVRASGGSGHAVVAPVLSWAGIHPRRPVMLQSKDTQASVELIPPPTRLSRPQLCQLTIGGWLLFPPDARGAPPWLRECPPEVGTGASPSSAMRDRYSLSIRALS